MSDRIESGTFDELMDRSSLGGRGARQLVARAPHDQVEAVHRLHDLRTGPRTLSPASAAVLGLSGPIVEASGRYDIRPDERYPGLPLTTRRLVIRPWTLDPADLDRLSELYSHPSVTWFLGPLGTSADKLVECWNQRMGDDPRHIAGAIELRETGVVAGTVICRPLPQGRHIEIGWHLHPDSERRGYATEAARALIGLEFQLGVAGLFTLVNPDNSKSQRVCRRLGMRYLGQTTRYGDVKMDLFHLAATPDRPAAPALPPQVVLSPRHPTRT